MRIKYEDISNAVAKGHFQIERQHIPGWTQDEITDQVCAVLQQHGAEIIDIPANCMERVCSTSPKTTKKP